MSYEISTSLPRPLKQGRSSGNKATLVARLSEHEERQQRDALSSSPMQVRKASFTSEPTDIPGIRNVPSPPPDARPDYLTVVLPDLRPQVEIESAPIVRETETQDTRMLTADSILAFRSRFLGFVEIQAKGPTASHGIRLSQGSDCCWCCYSSWRWTFPQPLLHARKYIL